MSRIGNAPISIPDGVTVTIEPARVAVAGPLGTLQQQVPTRMKIEPQCPTMDSSTDAIDGWSTVASSPCGSTP